MRGRARACAHGDTTPMPNASSRGLPTQDACRLSHSFRTQHPDLRRRRIDFCCHSSYARMLPEISAKNFPRNSWWAYLHSDGKKKVSNYIAGIVPVGPGRRYTLSIYSTTTLSIYYNILERNSILRSLLFVVLERSRRYGSYSLAKYKAAASIVWLVALVGIPSGYYTGRW